MCGEKSAPRITSPVSWGSPPHVRGKGFCAVEIHCCCGITPACAGKSGTVGAVGNAIGDHPRMCGEKGSRYREQIYSLGSPPHVRGKVTFVIECPQLPKDHPRMCGEKVLLWAGLARSMGSPPHVRGKDAHAAMRARVLRITPAHAGKRKLSKNTKHTSRDHPRTCGEKFCSERFTDFL